MKLVIVESPNKTKTISQFLGPEYKVMASVGHVRDLATSGKGGLGVDVEHGFKPTYVVMPNKSKVVAELKAACKKAEDVYIATDPDREGEAIAWHLACVLDLDVPTVKRLSFNAITKRAVLAAMENPSHIDMDLVASQETRRILDRIIGFDLSDLMKKKIRTKSAGRVQSVTLRMIVERQKEIDSFVPKKYWDVSGLFGEDKTEADLYSKDGQLFKPYSIDSEEKYKKILSELPKTFKVLPLSYTTRVTQPRPPFTTSTLEQEAFSQFKYSAKLTSSIAQRLFEGIEVEKGHFQALITYIRTDSTRLAPEFVDVAGQYIASHFGAGSYQGLGGDKKGALVQDAHEAIRPIDLTFTPAIAKGVLPPNMYNLYRLIYARSLASLMKPRVDKVTTLKFEGNGYIFKTEAVKNAEKGFQAVYDDQGLSAPVSGKVLPAAVLAAAENGTEVEAKEITGTAKETQPPYKYNDGTVVKLMEEKGIGRPSTYSSTISTLIDRDYVTEAKHALTPTDSGKLVVESLMKFFPDLMDYGYTRDMESDLEKVKEGDTSKNALLSTFYSKFIVLLQAAKDNMEKVKDVETGEKCPVCGSPLVIKHGRYGDFVACSNYPTCHYIKKEEKKVEVVEGRVCPKCGHQLVYRTSHKGEKFIGCSNFPRCTYTETLDGKTKETAATVANETNDPDHLVGTVCPRCHKGHLELKKSRFGSFYGCSNFPSCRYIQRIGKKADKGNKEDEGE
ncbi:MAG: type I DNA topoisomerase [Bacilli bacterium]|jgi:DNA topoisomerase-1|nr:type I DNA topoisomerase [Bacilli bacterium]